MQAAPGCQEASVGHFRASVAPNICPLAARAQFTTQAHMNTASRTAGMQGDGASFDAGLRAEGQTDLFSTGSTDQGQMRMLSL